MLTEEGRGIFLGASSESLCVIGLLSIVESYVPSILCDFFNSVLVAFAVPFPFVGEGMDY